MLIAQPSWLCERAQGRALLQRIIVLQRDQERDVGGDVARHAPRRGIDIALEEDVGNDGLQNHHGCHDDDQ